MSDARADVIARHRRRIWGLCYRMTGDASAADDLAQESLARALERGAQAHDASFEGWLYRVATTTCLDWLRRRGIERRVLALADPLALDELPCAPDAPDGGLARRDDLRFAIVCGLGALAPRQRAVLVLRDVLGRSVDETADTLGLTKANVKVVLHRARKKLDDVHRVGATDVPADADVVERFARALEAEDLGALTALLDDDVWGLVDDGLGKRRPNLGARPVAKQWANAMRRFAGAATLERAMVSGEPALVARVAGAPLASLCFETRASKVVAIRVVLDPSRLARLAARQSIAGGGHGVPSDSVSE